VETGSGSSFSFPTATSSIRRQWLAPQFIGSDYKDTLGYWIGNIDDPYISPRAGLPESDTRPLLPWAVFSWVAEDVRDFVLRNSMTINMWLPRFWIKIEANIHARDLIQNMVPDDP
jgi:hypothetical protein